MGRRPLGEEAPGLPGLDDALLSVERNLAANAAELWSATPSALTRVKAGSPHESVSEAAAMMAGGDWAEAKPRHLVALWAMCHERVYRASGMGELRGMGWRASVKAAASMLRDEFGGDAAAMAGFVRWCWLREEGKERWCKDRGFERHARLTWKRQFDAAVLADWRVDQARKGLR